MKIILSYILYYIGLFFAIVLRFVARFDNEKIDLFIYKIQNFCMIWSVNLDEHGQLWKDVTE